jgi:hypothetical protein
MFKGLQNIVGNIALSAITKEVSNDILTQSNAHKRSESKLQDLRVFLDNFYILKNDSKSKKNIYIIFFFA